MKIRLLLRRLYTLTHSSSFCHPMIKMMILFSLISTALFTVDKPDAPSSSPIITPQNKQPGYTINFENVSILEVLKFITKVADVNFIYKEEELNFNVSITSEEPTPLSNILSALVQILRINGFHLLEQEGNFIISKNAEVKQIPTVVSEEAPFEGEQAPVIVTRLFPIKNGNPASIATILKPMLSANAIIEVSEETRHIIVTDTTTNVDKVGTILLTLDAPDVGLEIEAYRSLHNNAKNLTDLLRQLVTPLAEGNPLILVPQPETNTIFIVSTPFVVEKVLSILEDLDSPPSITRTKSQSPFSSDNILLYKAQYRPTEVLLESLESIAENLEESGYKTTDLAHAIKTAKSIQDTQTLLFTADQSTLDEVQSLLETLDTKSTTGLSHDPLSSDFYIYSPRYLSAEETLQMVEEIGKNLEDSHLADPAFLKTLETAKINTITESILFTGDSTSLDRVKTLLSVLDKPQEGTQRKTLFVYKIQHVKPSALEDALKDLVANLPPDEPLARTVDSMRYLQESNSLSFNGLPSAITRLKEFLAIMDSEDRADAVQKTYQVYKLKNVSGDQLIKELKKTANNLEDADVGTASLVDTINNLRWIKATNSVLITGTPDTIKRVIALIDEFDIPHTAPQATEFFMYKVKNLDPQQVVSELKAIGDDMKNANLEDPTLIQTVNSAQTIEASNSILFTGTADSIAKVKELLLTIDIPEEERAPTPAKKIGKTTFFIYKPKNVSPFQLMDFLKSIAAGLSSQEGSEEELVKTIDSMRYVKDTHSIVFTGPPNALARVKSLIQDYDLPGVKGETVRTADGYIIYKPKYVSGPELINILHDFEQNLMHSGVDDKDLYDVINNLKWMEKTSSILISGNAEATQKVEDLIKRFDIPSAATEEPSIETFEDTSFLIYKLEYHKGNEIEDALKKIGADLQKGKNSNDNQNLYDAINSIQWIEVTNSLIASGNAKTLTKLRELIKGIDIPLKQVFIEILVLETSLTNVLNFGLRWGSQGKYRTKFGYGTGNFPQIPSDTTDPFSGFNTALADITATRTPTGGDIPIGASGFDLGVIGDIILHRGKSYFALGSLVNALRVDGDSTIVLNQKIITQDNKNSTIFVGSNVPFTGSVTNITGASSSTTTNLEYRDIGVSLSITPTVGNNDVVTLDIDEQITEQEESETQSDQPTSVTGITTSKTTTNTTVTVPNKSFLVISGQIRDTITRQTTSIPCLGGLPIIGAAFSQKDKTYENRNVIIFVRPHIINSFDEYKEITERQEDIYRDQSVAEDFDEGLELVKTPDDA